MEVVLQPSNFSSGTCFWCQGLGAGMQLAQRQWWVQAYERTAAKRCYKCWNSSCCLRLWLIANRQTDRVILPTRRMMPLFFYSYPFFSCFKFCNSVGFVTPSPQQSVPRLISREFSKLSLLRRVFVDETLVCALFGSTSSAFCVIAVSISSANRVFLFCNCGGFTSSWLWRLLVRVSTAPSIPTFAAKWNEGRSLGSTLTYRILRL